MKLRTAVAALAALGLSLFVSLPVTAEQNPYTQASENGSTFSSRFPSGQRSWDNIAKFEVNPALRTLFSNSYGTSCSAIANPYPYQWCADATTRSVKLNTQPVGGGAFGWAIALTIGDNGSIVYPPIALGSIGPSLLANGAAAANLGFLPVQSVAGRSGIVTIASADVTDGTAAGRALFTAASVAAQRSALGALASSNNLSDVANAATARTNLGAVNIAGDTFTGNVDVSPGAGWGVVRAHPLNAFGTFGGNLAQHESSFNIQSSTVDPSTPVVSGYKSTITTTTGTTADAWAILGTAAVTSTTPIPGGGTLGSGQNVGITGQFVRYNYAPGSNTVNPEGWGGVFTHSNISGVPPQISGGGLGVEVDVAADGPDTSGVDSTGVLTAGVVVVGSRAGVIKQVVTGTTANTSTTVTGVSVNLTGGAVIPGWGTVSVIGWTVDGTGIQGGGATTVTAVTSTTLTLSLPATASGAVSLTLRPPAQLGNMITATVGDVAGGVGASSVSARSLFLGSGSFRHAGLDLSQATPVSGANAILLADDMTLAWKTNGEFQTLFSASSGRVETRFQGVPVFSIDSIGEIRAPFFSGSLQNSTGLPLSTGVTGTLPTANSAALAGDVTKVAGTNNTVLATTQPSVHTWTLGQTFSGANIFNSTAGGWSSSNFSKALVVTISAATANPAIGLFDANNTNGTAFFSSSSGFQILAMPALSDSTTAAVNMITVSRTGLITGFNATLIASGTALTNGAGTATGTLTNAPAAGNPTKWVPINDNGTTRYIPAW